MKLIARTLPTTFLLALALYLASCSAAAGQERWSVERANSWYAGRPWPVGFNYLPRTAINQLEMWQATTFDPGTIDQELGWAANIGFNTARVYLHDLPWREDAAGFTRRIDRFLEIADSHGIGVMFVLFDDVWDPHPQPGPQREPRPGVHNSGWVQSPGAEILGDLSRHDELEAYIRGVITRYARDERVLAWDLYNEPGNTNGLSYGRAELEDKHRYTLALLEKVFAWARLEDPGQPLTAGVWRSRSGRWLGADPDDIGAALYDFMLDNSDIVTFHSYVDDKDTTALIAALRTLDRPMICTEYMARGHDSTFEDILPLFAQHDIGAIHWGLVSGRSQTIYPWRSWFALARFWDGLFSDEPDPWHHDLLRADGSAYADEEIALIGRVIENSARQ